MTNNIIKVGLDIGASRIKCSFVNPANQLINFSIPNRVSIGNSIGDSGYLVKYNNQIKRIGSSMGISNMQPLKINYNHLEEILLAVSYKVKKEFNIMDENITLMIETLLPPKQFFANGKDFRQKILDMQIISGVINSEKVNLIIGGVHVLCEGVALLNNLDFTSLSDKINQLLILDIGSSTANVIEIIKEDNMWNIGDVDTISEFGGTKMCKAIEQKLTSKYKTPYRYDLLEKNMSYTYNEVEYSILDESDCLNDMVEDFKLRLSQIKDYHQYKVILSGGASELLYSNKMMKDFIPTAKLLDKQIRIYGNSIGALIS